jgi:hypothetical protein
MNMCSMASFVLLCSLVLASCNDRNDSPTAPTVTTQTSATPAPMPAPLSLANWSADAMVTAFTFGGRTTPCGWGTSVGESRRGVQWRVTIEGNSILLDEDMGNWPTDDVPYTGTLNGRQFTATYESPADYLRYACQFEGGTLTGTFNADFSAFEAVEMLMWGAPAKETTVQRLWTGRRL